MIRSKLSRLPAKLPISLRPSKTWIVLGVALIIGAFAALGTRSYLTHRVAAIEARAKGRLTNVVVAKRDLPKGAKLNAETVAVRQVPADFAPSSAIAPGDFSRIEGQSLGYPLKSGEMVLWSLLEKARNPTFSARLGAGRRAITVAVDEINSISGLLEPGDAIDLLVTVDDQGRKRTLTVLAAAPVMATGQRVNEESKPGERKQYAAVTLDVTPTQALQVVAARESGRLTALLRHPNEAAAGAPPSSFMTWWEGRGRAAVVASGEPEVPVIYGGRAATSIQERGAAAPPAGLGAGGGVGSVGSVGSALSESPR